VGDDLGVYKQMCLIGAGGGVVLVMRGLCGVVGRGVRRLGRPCTFGGGVWSRRYRTRLDVCGGASCTFRFVHGVDTERALVFFIIETNPRLGLGT
jgi:hypothetical protein